MLPSILLAALPLVLGQEAPAPTALDDATRAAYEAAARYSEEHGGQALVVRSGGRIVFESYAEGSDAQAPFKLSTATKTFWTLAAVAAVDDGLLGLDEPVAEHLESWRGAPGKEGTTLRQLLQLESGIEADYRPVRKDTHDDKFAAAVEAGTHSRPGEVFDNGPAAYFVFGALLDSVLPEGDADVLAYLRRRVFEPAGIEFAYWTRDKAGNPHMPFGAYMTARDWSAVGQLVVEGGRVGERVVLRESTLRDALTASTVNPHFVMGWWRPSGFNRMGEALKDVWSEPVWSAERLAAHEAGLQGLPEDLLYSNGRGSQRLYVAPSLGLVVARLSVAAEGWSDANFLRLLLELPPLGEFTPGTPPSDG